LKARFQVARCELWAEFKGARADREIAAQAFQFAVPEGAKLLKRFLPPPPNAPAPLLARAPEDFSFVDLDGQTVTRESLQGKVVVLDMWATWCGWCFKGLPNLQEVYQRYRSSDKVAILAVNKDAPAMSDAKVRQAFENAQLTIPVVRDAAQITDKVFAIQVLPTMVVLGTDGTVQDYRVGYDAELATTLPAKIEKLLAGENLAQQQLAEYQQALEEYDQQLQKALVSGEANNPDEPEVARKPSMTE
jgi:thiol-disulfide isomerase/thioredoxin